MRRSWLPRSAGESADARSVRIEERLDAVSRVVERFAVDMAALMGGSPEPLADYIEPCVAAWLSEAITPTVRHGDIIRPDFGEYGDLRVDGDLLEAAGVVTATLGFEDLSMLETSDGRLVACPRRRVSLTLSLDASSLRVLDAEVKAAVVADP